VANQGRSYEAVVANLHYSRYRLGIFAASAEVPQISGISHHLEGNNIYGLYGHIGEPVRHSTREAFVLWRVQPSVTGREYSGVPGALRRAPAIALTFVWCRFSLFTRLKLGAVD
jgi:hypothetical protein